MNIVDEYLMLLATKVGGINLENDIPSAPVDIPDPATAEDVTKTVLEFIHDLNAGKKTVQTSNGALVTTKNWSAKTHGAKSQREFARNDLRRRHNDKFCA
ncbi:hypothetical protein ACTXT7_008811 [Hymenolepis weldensis]